MKRVTLGLAMGLMLGSASAQQVWRCELDGQVVYTDQPCEKGGRPLPSRLLKANVVDSLATAASAASGVSDAAAPPASAPASAADENAFAQPAKPAVAAVSGSHERRRTRAPRLALNGLMDTDFVQRGYVPRRQNPASTPNP